MLFCMPILSNPNVGKTTVLCRKDKKMAKPIRTYRPINATGNHPIRLTVEGIALRPEYRDILKKECEAFQKHLLDIFDQLEFEYPEEVNTCLETSDIIFGKLKD